MSSTRKARLFIAMLASLAIAIAFLPLSKKDHLKSWLRRGDSVLSDEQITALRRLLDHHLVQSGILDGYVLNDIGSSTQPSFVVIDGQGIPSVISPMPFNAAYDSSLDVIFIDEQLVELALEGEPDSPQVDLLLLVVLHELGHRHYHHGGVHTSQGQDRTVDGSSAALMRKETEADEFAFNSLLKIYSNAAIQPAEGRTGVASGEQIANRVNRLVEGFLLGPFLAKSSHQLSLFPISHPNLIQRCSNILATLSQWDIPDQIRENERALRDWLANTASDVRKYLAAEIASPNGSFFVIGTSIPQGAAFLLNDGRIAFVDAASFAPRGQATFVSPAIMGTPLEGTSAWNLTVQLTSGSLLWYQRGSLLLLRPHGRLSYANPLTGWAWRTRNEPVTQTVGKALVAVHIPPPGDQSYVIARTMRGIHVYRFDGSVDQDMFVEILHLEDKSDALAEDNTTQYSYGGALGNSLYIVEKRGVVFNPHWFSILRADLSSLRENDQHLSRIVAFPENEAVVLDDIAVVGKNDDLVGIKRVNGWQTIDIVNLNPNGLGHRIGRFQPYLPSTGTEQLSRQAAFTGAGLRQKVYAVRDQHQVVVSVYQLGLFVFDLSTNQPVIRGGPGRSQFFSFQLESLPMVAQCPYGGSRALVWRTK